MKRREFRGSSKSECDAQTRSRRSDELGGPTASLVTHTTHQTAIRLRMKTRIAARSILRPAACDRWSVRPSLLRLAKFTAQCGQNRPLHSTSAAFRASLFRLQDAQIPQLKDRTGASNTLSIDIQDGGKEEAWAITGPAAEKGGAAKAAVVKVR